MPARKSKKKPHVRRRRPRQVCTFKPGEIELAADAALRHGVSKLRCQPMGKIQGEGCNVCGCTDDDCQQCVERTGEPCRWILPRLCSACVQLFVEVLTENLGGTVSRPGRP